MAVDTTQRGGISWNTKFVPAQYNVSPPGVQTGGKTDASADPVYTPATGLLQPVPVLIGILALIVLLKIIGESPKTSIDGADIHVGGYNVVVILAIVFAGTALTRLLFNYVHVPGVTDLVNFI